MCDQGPGLIGHVWEQFADRWGVQLICTEKEASHSNGMAEKHIDIAKCGFLKARQMFVADTDIKILEQVVLAKNMAPCISSGLSPMASFLGRNDLAIALESYPQEEELPTGNAEGAVSIQNHLFRLFELREYLCRQEALRVLK